MAQTILPATPTTHHHRFDVNLARARASTWAIPIGRFFFALIFVFASFGHFLGETIKQGAAHGVPFAETLVPLSGVLAMIGGVCVMAGYHQRIGALLILAFLVPVTFTMHNFWAYSNPQEIQMQMTHFMKNVALMGGAVLIMFQGMGPSELDPSIEN